MYRSTNTRPLARRVPFAPVRAGSHRPSALRARFVAARRSVDMGMTTAEYAIGTIAACAFAGVLFKVVTGQQVVGLLTAAVGRALATLTGA